MTAGKRWRALERVTAGILKPQVSGRLPLDRAAEAHERLERGDNSRGRSLQSGWLINGSNTGNGRGGDGFCARKTGIFRTARAVRRRHRHVINSMIVRAQIHGGLAQGTGPALKESETYKVDSGQILARSFLDYGIPRTDDLIAFAGSQTSPALHQ